MVAELKAEKRLWTYSELPPWDGQTRLEIYDGELLEMPSPNLRHQELIRRLLRLLDAWVLEHDAGKVYLSPVDLYLSETRVFIPDLMFVAQERLSAQRIEREDGQCLVAPPDLVVEILSPATSRRDWLAKLNAYAAFGVRHYWIINPDENLLHAHVLQGEHYQIEAVQGDEDAFSPSLFPGLQISLAALFQQ